MDLRQVSLSVCFPPFTRPYFSPQNVHNEPSIFSISSNQSPRRLPLEAASSSYIGSKSRFGAGYHGHFCASFPGSEIAGTNTGTGYS